MENRILFSLSSRVTAFRRSDFCCEKLLFFTKTIRNVLLMKQRYITASVFSVPAETNTWKNTIFQTAERYSTLFIPCTPKTVHIHVAPPHSYYLYLPTRRYGQYVHIVSEIEMINSRRSHRPDRSNNHALLAAI